MTMPQDCDAEVFDLMAQAADLPRGRDRIAILERALATAQRLGGFDNEYWARSQLVEALYYVPNERANLTHYAWLRKALDTAGERLDEEDRAQVLWKLKWAMDQVIGTADLDLATVRATLDDVEGAFRAHGYRLRPVFDHRFHLAVDLEDISGQQAAVAGFHREPRDRVSDCHACERSFEARLLTDRPAEALAAIEPILRGELTCGEQPALALAQAIGWHLDSGDTAAALAAYRRGWPLLKDNPKLVRSAAEVLLGLVRLGELDRAVDALVPRLGWLDGTADDNHREVFAAVGALVLGAAADRGLAPATIAGRPVGDVRQELRERAYAVAATFDARNGTSVHTRRVDELLDTPVGAEPTLPPLRLGARGGSLGARVGEDTGAVRQGRVGQARVTSPVLSVGVLAEQLRTRLDELGEDVEQLLDSWREHRAELRAGLADGDPQWVEVAFLDRLISTDAEPEPARALLADALAAADRVGDPVGRRRAEAEVHLLDWAQAQVGAESPTADALAGVRSIATGFEAGRAWVEAAATWRRLGVVTREAGDLDLAREAFEHALDTQRLAGPPLRVALLLVELAQLLPSVDPVRSEALASEAAQLAETAKHPLMTAAAADVRARLACARGEFETARALLSAAVPAAVGSGAEPSLRTLCADVCIDLQDWALLADQGSALVALARARRDPALLALGQRHLGLALVETGRHAEAAELLEAALARMKTQEPALVGPIGWALGNALSGSGEPGAARTAYASAATAFEASERFDEAAHAQARAGDTAWDCEDTVAAGAHYESCLEHARRAGSVEPFAIAARSLAALRMLAGESVAGLADLDAVPEQARALAAERGHPDADDWPERLTFGVMRQGARILYGAGDPRAAAERLAAYEPTLLGEAAAVLRAEWGSYLAAAGELDSAGRLLEEALPQLTAEHLRGLAVDCVGRWAQALYDAGQVETADEVWERFGE